jgi:hypothetical protein
MNWLEMRVRHDIRPLLPVLMLVILSHHLRTLEGMATGPPPKILFDFETCSRNRTFSFRVPIWEPEKVKGLHLPPPISTISSQEREAVISPNKVITVVVDDPGTPANGSSIHDRAERVTSMANFCPINEDLPPNAALPAVRTYKALTQTLALAY